MAIIYEKEPGRIIVARKDSPLVIGLGDGENFIASDIPAILGYTRKMVFLDDGEMAILEKDGFKITDFKGKLLYKEPKEILWDPTTAEKGGFKHFMLKEIFEQPKAILDTLRGRVSEAKDKIFFAEAPGLKNLRKIKRIFIVACGTSYHAALVGKFILEEFLKIPVEVDLASEFRYRNPLVNKDTLLILISQSGETADTLAALREGKRKGSRILSICNVIGSSLARESDEVIYTRAGPEIGVASTKAFTTQLVVLYLLGLYLGASRIEARRRKKLIKELRELPEKVEEILKKELAEIAKEYAHYENFLYLARGINYPIAMEGALKLKEISYIHAEAHASGEMKHGPIALIDERMPVLVLLTKGNTYSKVLANIEEVKARGGKIIVVTTEKKKDLASKVERIIQVPKIDPLLAPILLTIPLQLFAYYIALRRGTDVDQPRNLAKSVTVE